MDATKLVSAIVFFLAVILWGAFGLALLLRQGDLDDVWSWFRSQAFLLQAIEFVIFLPWALALWIWTTDWALWIRVILLAGLAWASLYLLFPWRGK